MKDDYAMNSHRLTDTFLLEGWENVLFELGDQVNSFNQLSVGTSPDGKQNCCSYESCIVSES